MGPLESLLESWLYIGSVTLGDVEHTRVCMVTCIKFETFSPIVRDQFPLSFSVVL